MAGCLLGIRLNGRKRATRSMMQHELHHHAVIGGGLLGMTTALRLAQAGHRVTLIEAREQLGGLADAWTLGDIRWDRHYHVTLLSDANTRKILRELGLDDQMRWVPSRTGFFTDGALHSLSSTLEFLRFRPLSLWARLRLGLTIFAGSRIRNWRRLEQIPVAQWLTKWSGKQTFEKIWKPLLRSKLGDNYQKTSAAFIWATIARLYAARRTGLKKEMFGYLPGGYGRMLQAFEQHLRNAGVAILTGQPVASVVHHADRFSNRLCIRTLPGDEILCDRVILTVPSRRVPGMVPQMDPAEASMHQAIAYQGIVCASLLLKQPLADFYVTNITDGNVPFTGVIEMSALVDPAELGGHTLVYLPFYVPEDDPALEWSDEEVREQSLEGLRAMYPAFSDEDVLAFRVSRERYVMAIPTIDYSLKLPPQETSVPGVFVVNSAQIVNGTLNVHETVGLAETAAREILQSPVAVTDLSESAVKEPQRV